MMSLKDEEQKVENALQSFRDKAVHEFQKLKELVLSHIRLGNQADPIAQHIDNALDSILTHDATQPFVAPGTAEAEPTKAGNAVGAMSNAPVEPVEAAPPAAAPVASGNGTSNDSTSDLSNQDGQLPPKDGETLPKTGDETPPKEGESNPGNTGNQQ
jgi:hypothetical protein